MTRLIVSGCFGRMGEVVCRLAAENPRMSEVVAGIDLEFTDDSSCSSRTGFPMHLSNFSSYESIRFCNDSADAIICFLPPNAEAELLDTLEKSAEKGLPLVFCTTGQSAKVNDAIAKAAKKAAVLRSGNMSLGINLLSGVLAKIAPLLHESGFDIEITEKHHNQKIDAPSGTAFLLADSINNSLGKKMRYVHDRSGAHEKRSRDEIGLHALRGGTIVGEHTVTFAGHNEVIELKHIAQSREVFAVGAIKAAQFLVGKPPGLYTMQDVTDD
ncbi:MAG: 4-hydroxy-tetrahydrodipicolinate reductase [Defluviitaleaceae bacterium]|nr:4-hydroxy-tetrahydrodipicolinate reductase [Defluviitaleaceae bacterium]